MTIYRVVDTETCDLDSGIVEIASIDIIDIQINYSTQQSHLTNPKKPISVSAMAIHHITDEMVINSPLIDEVIGIYKGADYLVAHNAEFDKKMMPKMDAPFICTLKLARRLWPDMESHSNQYLRYALKLGVRVPEGLHAHRALYDCIVTAELFKFIKDESGWSDNEMLEISNQPSLLHRFKFGKYNGMTFEEVKKENIGYFHWLLKQPNLDHDVKFTISYWLSR
ncbi:DNA polymerase III epsilon subunit-like 3'-5' exonuclease [Photorhabdus temperata subsp. temperata Meg1]|uniref:DNA polymerase III epsilon subunit-like 3'-5' exonuclease n=1 Tax=Photorhabdus temperata subsp. temperata Meg1 TaxID=1393735 RepID=A0A081RQY1_PHOTE|nr:DNA polymerase III epsilon subunit-like 3'-5' exonuclease [Photorhabdus temperata subsp. temperata Meg1]